MTRELHSAWIVAAHEAGHIIGHTRACAAPRLPPPALHKKRGFGFRHGRPRAARGVARHATHRHLPTLSLVRYTMNKARESLQAPRADVSSPDRPADATRAQHIHTRQHAAQASQAVPRGAARFTVALRRPTSHRGSASLENLPAWAPACIVRIDHHALPSSPRPSVGRPRVPRQAPSCLRRQSCSSARPSS